LGILTDRSRIETDWSCPRKRYWLTEYEGKGIVPATAPPAFSFGTVVHAGIEMGIVEEGKASRTPPWIAREAFAPIPEWGALTNDQQDCAVAIVRGFFLTVWPQWMAQYEPIAIEQEFTMQVSDVTFMVRPDLLLKDKQTGDIWYPDFKTFTSNFDARKWTWSLQQHLTMLVCEHVLGTPLAGSWIQGLGKGSGRKGVLYHPLVYGYRHPGTPGVSEPTFGSQRRAGFERFNTKEYPQGGVDGWIQQLRKKSPELVAKVYPQTQPLFLNRTLMEEVLPQIISREHAINKRTRIGGPHPSDDARDALFPMHITQCETNFGRCQYFDACHVPVIHKDPLGSGSYVQRVPHHAMEQQTSIGGPHHVETVDAS
jgi:hypothetical protein